MDDKQIIELFFARSEAAIAQTEKKYGKYCHTIAWNILHNEQDSEECVNDAFLRAWNAIPPRQPNNLSTFLAKITRNLALDRYKYNISEKRGRGQTALALDELAECLPAEHDVDKAIGDKELTAALNTFLAALPEKKRQLFVRRYWYLSPIAEIAGDYAMSESHVKVMLHRTRKELKGYLEKAGIIV